jgi:hypothetical protein
MSVDFSFNNVENKAESDSTMRGIPYEEVKDE